MLANRSRISGVFAFRVVAAFGKRELTQQTFFQQRYSHFVGSANISHNQTYQITQTIFRLRFFGKLLDDPGLNIAALSVADI